MPCPSSISLLVSFCYSNSQKASFSLNCRSFLPVQISTNLTYIHIFLNSIVSIQLSVILLDGTSTNLAYPSSIRLLVSFCYSYYSQKASFPLNYRSCLPFLISMNLGFPSSINLSVSFCYSYSQKASFPLNCRSFYQFRYIDIYEFCIS